jgi:Arc/MetJ-type ribon-helix-helix transcriptional regulator
MPLTVRLDPRTERALNRLARRRRQSRSELVREALVRFEADAGGGDSGSRPYDAWLDVIGIVGLGARDSTRSTGDRFTALIAEKARARRAR